MLERGNRVFIRSDLKIRERYGPVAFTSHMKKGMWVTVEDYLQNCRVFTIEEDAYHYYTLEMIDMHTTIGVSRDNDSFNKTLEGIHNKYNRYLQDNKYMKDLTNEKDNSPNVGYMSRYALSESLISNIRNNSYIRSSDNSQSSLNNQTTTKSFTELKLLKEREWLEWKEKLLNEPTTFLDMVFVPNSDNIAKMKIRLRLMGSHEIYSRGIVDDMGVIHYNIRRVEIEHLIDHMKDVYQQRKKRVGLVWDLIQKAERSYELPELDIPMEKPTMPTGPTPRYIKG